MIGLKTSGSNGSDSGLWKSSILTTIQLPIGKRFFTCLSKTVSYQANMVITKDQIYFNATSLSKKNFVMRVHVHQVGHVMQEFRATPLLQIQINNLSKIKQNTSTA